MYFVDIVLCKRGGEMQTGLVAKVGKFHIYNLMQDWFALDGGVLFGGIPKSVWEKLPGLRFVKSANMVPLPINTFMIRTPSKNILVDTSCGDMNRWSEGTRKQFRMRQSEPVDDALIVRGLWRRDIHCVIHTHLHFDHAGGDVRFEDGKLVPAFPRAVYIMNKGELAQALSVHFKTRSSYRRETVAGLQVLAEKHLIREFNQAPLALYWTMQVEPGITLVATPGHTQNHFSVLIEDEGETAFIAGALLTTRWHTRSAYSIGNDTHPYDGANCKAEYLKKAAEGKWLVLLEHDTQFAGHIVPDESAQFRFDPLTEERWIICKGQSVR